MTKDELKAKLDFNKFTTDSKIMSRGLKYHHTSSRRGYCSAADVGRSEEYSGRFGAG